MFYKKNNHAYKKIIDGVTFISLVNGEKTHLTEFRLEKGGRIPRHSHPQEQTGYLISGKLTFTIGDETVEAEPGDAWNIPGGVEHGVDVLENTLVIEVFSPIREDYLLHT